MEIFFEEKGQNYFGQKQDLSSALGRTISPKLFRVNKSTAAAGMCSGDLRISRRPVYLQSGGSVFSPKYLSGAGVSSDPISILHIYYIYKYQSRAGVSSQKKEVVGGRCVTNGKEETQLRSDDLSS